MMVVVAMFHPHSIYSILFIVITIVSIIIIICIFLVCTCLTRSMRPRREHIEYCILEYYYKYICRYYYCYNYYYYDFSFIIIFEHFFVVVHLSETLDQFLVACVFRSRHIFSFVVVQHFFLCFFLSHAQSLETWHRTAETEKYTNTQTDINIWYFCILQSALH